MSADPIAGEGVAPESSRPYTAAALLTHTRPILAEATEAERAALAARLGLRAIEALRFEAATAHWRGPGLRIDMRLIASVEQECVVTLQPVRAEVDETVIRGYLPADRLAPPPEAVGKEIPIEFDAEIDDSPELLTDVLDLGEVAAEALSLALDPFPRSPDADKALAAAAGDAPEKPFAALAALRDRLGGGE